MRFVLQLVVVLLVCLGGLVVSVPTGAIDLQARLLGSSSGALPPLLADPEDGRLSVVSLAL